MRNIRILQFSVLDISIPRNVHPVSMECWQTYDCLWFLSCVMIHMCLNTQMELFNNLLNEIYVFLICTPLRNIVLRLEALMNNQHSSIHCFLKCVMISTLRFNLWWPSDAIWRQRSGPTFAQVMSCCLRAPSHYLNQCWLIISEIQWHSY